MVFHKNPLIVRNVQFLKKLKKRTLKLPTRGKGKKEKKKFASRSFFINYLADPGLTYGN